jgi:hypothetical protein
MMQTVAVADGPPSTTAEDVIGLEQSMRLLRRTREVFERPHRSGIQLGDGNMPARYRRLIVYGPGGTGKALMANCVAGELRHPVVRIHHITEIGSGYYNVFEQNLNELDGACTDQNPCTRFMNCCCTDGVFVIDVGRGWGREGFRDAVESRIGGANADLTFVKLSVERVASYLMDGATGAPATAIATALSQAWQDAVTHRD